MECADIMSSLMLSMTCKRINTIYNSNSYITNKNIPLKVFLYSEYDIIGIYELVVNIKMCNSIETIAERMMYIFTQMYGYKTTFTIANIYNNIGYFELSICPYLKIWLNYSSSYNVNCKDSSITSKTLVGYIWEHINYADIELKQV